MVELEEFADYLRDRGLSPKTVSVYCHHVGHEGGVDRLRQRRLAPKTRRLILGSFRAYGRFLSSSDDTRVEGAELLSELDDVRLPAPVRKRVQKPLPEPFYRELLSAIDDSDRVSDAMRGTLGLMARRGLRRGDVFRLDRKTVAEATRSGVLSYEMKGERFFEVRVLGSFRGSLELLLDSWSDLGPGGRTARVWSLLGPSQASAEQNVARALRRVAGEVDLEEHGVSLADVRPHVLRRTYATLFYEACGRDPVKLMRHCGWTQIQTAMGYVDFVKAEELDEIAEDMLR